MKRLFCDRIIATAVAVVCLVLLLLACGCASQKPQLESTTPTPAMTVDDETDADDATADCIIDGESASCVPVRTARVTIIGASAAEMQEALRIAELEALCPRPPVLATAGDRDVGICEP